MAQAIDLVFTMDTTGSMWPCTKEARFKIATAMHDLFKSVPNLRVGMIAHGDYCDRGRSYVTKIFPLTEDEGKICFAVLDVGPTGGGDADECYELVMAQAREEIAWRPEARKILVMVGDASAHRKNEAQNERHLDWKEELVKLAGSGITAYAVQCLNRRYNNHFWQGIADSAGTPKLELAQFSIITETISAICYQQVGGDQLDVYATKLTEERLMNRGIADIIARLQGKDSRKELARRFGAADVDAVEMGRFQLLTVDSACKISDFVTSTGAVFKTGKGFYEWTKSEEIRKGREIVMVHESGEMITGPAARLKLGIPLDRNITLSPRTTKIPAGYTVYIQSTSYTRKLVPGTKFLYEVDSY